MSSILLGKVRALEHHVDRVIVENVRLSEENIDLQRQIDAITHNINVIFERFETIEETLEDELG